jgi:hypothetical protein
MMTAIFRAALVAAFTAACIPTVAVGQNVSTDSLLRRIDSLQRTTADLERRVGALEANLKAEPPRTPPTPALPNSGNVATWRQLHRGMSPDAVRALLGEPVKVRASSGFTFWQYPDDADVTFISDKVDGWSEPRQ